MYAQLLIPLVLASAAPISGSVLLAANSQDFRRVAEKVLPRAMADKITNYLKDLSLSSRKFNNKEIIKYLNDEIDGGDVYRQDPASFINEEQSKRHYSVNVKDLVGTVKGLLSNLFDEDHNGARGLNPEDFKFESEDEDRGYSKKRPSKKLDSVYKFDQSRESKRPGLVFDSIEDSGENRAKKVQDTNVGKKERQRDSGHSKKYFKYYTTRSFTTTEKIVNKAEAEKSLDDNNENVKEVSFEQVPLGGQSSNEREKDRDRDSYENDKRFTRIFKEDEDETHGSRNTKKAVEKFKKHKNNKEPTENDKSDVETILETKTLEYTTKSLLKYDPETEILEPKSPFKTEHHKIKNDKVKYEDSSEERYIKHKNIGKEKNKENDKSREQRDVESKSKQTRFQIADEAHDIGRSKAADNIEAGRIKTAEHDFGRSNQDNGRNKPKEDLVRFKPKGPDFKQPEKQTFGSFISEVKDKIGYSTSSVRTPVKYHDDLVEKGQSIRDVEREPINKIIGTKIPKRTRFTMATPDYYHKQENIAVTQDEREPIPQDDREEEKFPKDRPYLTGIINGKKQIINQDHKQSYLEHREANLEPRPLRRGRERI